MSRLEYGLGAAVLIGAVSLWATALTMLDAALRAYYGGR